MKWPKPGLWQRAANETIDDREAAESDGDPEDDQAKASLIKSAKVNGVVFFLEACGRRHNGPTLN